MTVNNDDSNQDNDIINRSDDIMERFIRGDLRRRRPPLRRPLLLSNSILYSNPFGSDNEQDNRDRSELISNLRTRFSHMNIEEDINNVNSIFDRHKKEKKKLEKFKKNYKKLIDKMPLKMLEDIVKNNKCSICLEEKVDFEVKYLVTSCFHMFHEKCLQEAQNFNKRCPMCRTDLHNSFYKKVQLKLEDKGVGEF